MVLSSLLSPTWEGKPRVEEDWLLTWAHAGDLVSYEVYNQRKDEVDQCGSLSITHCREGWGALVSPDFFVEVKHVEEWEPQSMPSAKNLGG